ncbi:MAG TPA: hypothetical protein PLE74_05325 [Candidatus Cloacimonadota bacterium]|nr:hypothetical protein [Candidatus Cloacimonadota bacterium]
MELIKEIGSLALKEGVRVYLVGGFVRDLYLGHLSPDMDFTVEGDGILFAEKVAAHYHTNCKAFTRFGTAILHIPGHRKIDFVSARAESYPRSGALPEVVFADIGSDLTRRDFTINALALSIQEDDFGMLYGLDESLDDLNHGIIRVIHSGSFKDDPTRILRGIRFEKRFGYSIEPGTLELMKQSIDDGDLHIISVERIRNEFELAFKEQNPELFFQRAEQLGIMSSIFPGMKIPPNMGAKIHTYHETHREWTSLKIPQHLYQIYFIVLFSNFRFPENLKCAKFLKLKWLSITYREFNHFERHIRQKILHTDRLGIVWRALKGLHHLTLYMILCEERNPYIKSMVEKLLMKEQAIRPFLSGTDLIDMGIEAGRSVGRILDRIYMASLEGHIRSIADEKVLALSLWQKHLENRKKESATQED